MSLAQDLRLLGNPEADDAYEQAVVAWGYYLISATKEGQARAVSAYCKNIVKLSNMLSYRPGSRYFSEMEETIREDARDLARTWWTENGLNV